jgi:hypothetical protein
MAISSQVSISCEYAKSIPASSPASRSARENSAAPGTLRGGIFIRRPLPGLGASYSSAMATQNAGMLL